MTACGRSFRAQDGFTIVEMLIAGVITVVVMAATFALMNPAQGMFAAQPDVTEMQQRLRIAVDTLTKDLLMAGGGIYSGSSKGSLAHCCASILPYRIGNLSPDPAGQFFTNRITVMYVPSTAAQTTISDPISSIVAEVRVATRPGCPIGDEVCGFREGMTALIMDDAGFSDVFTVTKLQGPSLQLEHQGAALNKLYEAGSYISQIVLYTYWLKIDTSAHIYQLMRYDGDRTDVPIADNVVGLAFEYYGEPRPPQLEPRREAVATYGPSPPASGVDNPFDSWGAAENCTFISSSNTQLPRLGWLAGGGTSLVKLAPAQLIDGPWCPDASAPGRYDADLLRVRRVRVTLRLQVENRANRGVGGSLFKNAGISKSAERYLPDQEIKIDVAPRNLGMVR